MSDSATTIRYRPARELGGGKTDERPFREALRGLAVDASGRLFAVGDSEIQVRDGEGDLLRRWPTSQAGHAVAVDSRQRVWVGGWQQVEIFDLEGRSLDRWRDPQRLGLITAIVVGADDVLLGDATHRRIHRYDAAGRYRNAIGDRHRKGGFHIPNGVVDFAVDRDGQIRVANPGMHRVESYGADGESLGHFGRFDGQDPAGFPGCCNPTNLALDPQGRIAVSEKAGARVKLYGADGRFLGVLADSARGELDPLSKNMDLAIDAAGRIYVADAAVRRIVVLEPAEARS